MTISLRTMLILTFVMLVISTQVLAGSSDDNCDPKMGITFMNWRNWTPVTVKPVVSEGHSNNWVGVFVNKIAKAKYLSAGSPYPVCAKIVKPIYLDETGTKVLKLTVMLKMPPGYDPENGDWWYASYDKTGEFSWQQGKLSGCIPCHKQATDTDYLFSREVRKAAK